MKDFFGNEIKVGDYVVYPAIVGRTMIEQFVVKVIGFTEHRVKILRKHWSNELTEAYFMSPERSIIISEELAFEKEPLFKDL